MEGRSLKAQLLFEIISDCYERKSLIINTNIEFSRWVNVFYDEQMTSAIVDRVLHHCQLLLFPGQSNRASKKWTMPLRQWKPAMNRFQLEYGDRFSNE